MTGLEQMVKWVEKEPDLIYKDYKDICTAKMMSFKACIDKARALLAEEQSQPPANADLVGELTQVLEDWEINGNPMQKLELEAILSKYRPAPKEVKEPAAKETPCTVSDFDCSGPCPYADKNRCIPCGYKKSDCPIHSVKEQGEEGWKKVKCPKYAECHCGPSKEPYDGDCPTNAIISECVVVVHAPVASGLEDRTSKLVGRLRELLKDRKYCFYDPAENVTYPMTSIIGAISEILADYDKEAK